MRVKNPVEPLSIILFNYARMKMLMMLFNLSFLWLLGLTGAGNEHIQYLDLLETSQNTLETPQHAEHIPRAVFLGDVYLNEVSSSVLKAESWVRIHVLSYYPASRVVTIVVGDTVFCNKDQNAKLGLILSSVKNIYYSLTRWGMEKDIKVSAAFSPNCLVSDSVLFSHELSRSFVESLLEFLRKTNSTYSVGSTSPTKIFTFSQDTSRVWSSHTEFVKKVGSLGLNKINVLINTRRDRRLVDSFPARPTPFPATRQSPLQSPVGYSIPANDVAKTPQPASPYHISSPPLPPLTFPTAPEQPPAFVPAMPPFGLSFPPCNPAPEVSDAPSPQRGEVEVQRLWCVAKPSVPEGTLQVAMDYACGEGGGDCEEILPNGSCYYPNTVIAHASYAFNSYWQKSRRNGGTCSFGGTAMLINADPSFLHCRFVLI